MHTMSPVQFGVRFPGPHRIRKQGGDQPKPEVAAPAGAPAPEHGIGGVNFLIGQAIERFQDALAQGQVSVLSKKRGSRSAPLEMTVEINGKRFTLSDNSMCSLGSVPRSIRLEAQDDSELLAYQGPGCFGTAKAYYCGPNAYDNKINAATWAQEAQALLRQIAGLDA